MPIELKMPALSPTMERGTLAKWLVKAGDAVEPGDVLAEIETDKATMEIEAIDAGRIYAILVNAGTTDVAVGTPIATLHEEGEKSQAAPAIAIDEPPLAPAIAPAAEKPQAGGAITQDALPMDPSASPLARRIAFDRHLDLSKIVGSGPKGRIIKADVLPRPAARDALAAPAALSSPAPLDIPHESVKLSNMRKTIATRLSAAKQQIPHIYLTLDCRLDALLALREELNAMLAPRGIKLSVNDLLIKALARSLMEVPACNVSFAGDSITAYKRADISVAVSIPNGLITPILTEADSKSLSAISSEMKALAARAREGKLAPHEYQGGTASISNMGMYGIRQFNAIINPPQAMIMAIGAGRKQPWIVNETLSTATVMSVTGSFDHRAIDGADGAQLMQAFQTLVETPLLLVA